MTVLQLKTWDCGTCQIYISLFFVLITIFYSKIFPGLFLHIVWMLYPSLSSTTMSGDLHFAVRIEEEKKLASLGPTASTLLLLFSR